jgi:hypothetical protein
MLLNREIVFSAHCQSLRRLTIAEQHYLTDSNVYYFAQLLYYFRVNALNANAEGIKEYLVRHSRDVAAKKDLYVELEREFYAQRTRSSGVDSWDLRVIPPSGPGVRTRERYRHVARPRFSSLRFEGATFDAPVRARRVVENLTNGAQQGVLRFALPDLQLLLIESMTHEICSKTASELSYYNLLRWDDHGPYVVVESSGILEQCFRAHLTYISSALVGFVKECVLPGQDLASDHDAPSAYLSFMG